MFSIEMDDLGTRLYYVIYSVMFPQGITDLKPRAIMNELQISDCYEWFSSVGTGMSKNMNTKQTILERLEMLCFKNDNNTALEKEAATVLIPLVCGGLASIHTSRCIYQGKPFTSDILNLYRLSFDFDLLYNMLKFASMLYCKGQYEAAGKYLTYCEGLLGVLCGNTVVVLETKQQKQYMEKIINTPFKDMLMRYTVFHVIFTQQDIHCVPQHLVFEMFRTITDEDRQQRHPENFYEWMDLIVIDTIPFLHYLQYLTHRQLNQRYRKLVALFNLAYYISLSECRGNIDTTLNMLGHCCELENNLHLAWLCYIRSLRLYPRHNAANWHVVMIMYQHIHRCRIRL
ncbi:uncharacterized protein LOC128244926 [Mya arenaria]|uniref:uncharacterized protein LOC128244926 n=1 Tax=Mya arenaria TaxID=6604 RepID=UPI0022E903EE|nr:uncharacterized protein LOC128244926 [Mya arenaria]